MESLNNFRNIISENCGNLGQGLIVAEFTHINKVFSSANEGKMMKKAQVRQFSLRIKIYNIKCKLYCIYSFFLQN